MRVWIVAAGVAVLSCASPPLRVFEDRWYGKHLLAAGEGSLEPTRRAGRMTYRFTYLPSFSNPIVIRLERDGTRVTLVSKRLSGLGGYEPGFVEAELAVDLSREDGDHFEAIFGQLDFWKLVSHDVLVDRRLRLCRLGLTVCWLGGDGEMWILEAADETRYHAADRWSDVSGPFREAGLFLMERSGLVPEEALTSLRETSP